MGTPPNAPRGARVPVPLLRVINRGVVILARLLRRGDLRIIGQPVLILTTLGARSGRPHRVPLLYFPAGPAQWLIVASFGGSARHPAWYTNLLRHPDQLWIEVRGTTIPVTAAPVVGEARTAVWADIVARAPTYATYQAKTDRVIPVVRLTPVVGAQPQQIPGSTRLP